MQSFSSEFSPVSKVDFNNDLIIIYVDKNFQIIFSSVIKEIELNYNIELFTCFNNCRSIIFNIYYVSIDIHVVGGLFF